MVSQRELDAYHFYEDDVSDYEELMGAFEWEIPETFNIATYISERWADEEGRVALLAEDDAGNTYTVTYREMDRIGNRIANYLASEGIERGDAVGVMLPQRPEAAFAHVGILKLGAVAVPLSTLLGPDAISYRLNDCEAPAVITDDASMGTVRKAWSDFESVETDLTMDDADENSETTSLRMVRSEHSPEFSAVDTTSRDRAMILYTSGSTGQPKGAVYTHAYLLGSLPGFLTFCCNMEDLRDGIVDVHWTPTEWTWVGSLYTTVFPPLFYGLRLLAYADDRFDPHSAFEVLEEHNVNHIHSPPAALQQMRSKVEDPYSYDITELAVVSSGGDTVSESLVEWTKSVFPGTAVHSGYGQTEAIFVTHECEGLGVARRGSIGKPAIGHDATVLDQHSPNERVAQGETGEIAVRYEGNPVFFDGYLNKPEKTGEKIPNKWLLTEDLGLIDEDGYYWFKGRKDDVIISSGYRIGPSEIEDCLLDHDAVINTGIVGIPDDQRGQAPKAFVMLAPGYDPTEEMREELKSHVRDRLAKFKYPREIEFRDNLPTTSTGKIRRHLLKEDG